MPSLSALNEFRNSFSNIANEREDLLSKNLPYSLPDLPDTEAPPFEPPAREAAPVTASGLPSDFFDNADDDSAGGDTADTPDSGAGAGLGNFDFSAFLNSVPEDTPPPPEVPTETPFEDTLSDNAPQAADEPPSDEGTSLADTNDFLNSLGLDTPQDAAAGEPPAEEPPASEPPAADDFSVPPDLLSGLSDEIESAPADFPPEEPAATEAPPDDFSFDGLTPEEPAAEEPPAEETPPADEQAGGGFDLGGERQDGTLGSDGDSGSFMPTEDTSDETSAAETPAAETPTADFDLPADIGLPAEAEAPADGAPSADFELPTDFDLPTEAETPPAEADAPLPDFELPTDAETPPAEADTPLPDFDLPTEAPSDASAAEAPPANEGVDLGGEPRFDEVPIDLGGETPHEDPGATEEFDLSGMDIDPNAPADAAPSDGTPDDSSALPDMGDFDAAEPTDAAPADTAPSDTASVADDSALPDMGDFDAAEPTPADAAPAADSGEPLNMADFGDEFASDSIELENEPQDSPDTGAVAAPSATFSDDDFNLQGLDELLNKSKAPPPPKPAPKKGFFARRKEEAEAEAEEEEFSSGDSDEIKLSQEDLDRLLATLATYPLNLRVACEELIAEQVILPQQLSKLIRMLIKGAHVREMAEFAGQILGREIVIPRGYEKSSGAEWEAEKASFAYIFVHNFLPVLRLVAMAAALLASMVYLGYKFVYMPLKAESLYKRGYERIGAGEYQRANELFQEASNLHRKKKWYYNYAEGFRDQRRYLLAENKYDELLRFYPRDKKGVLDYANLETNYLLNYEKADKLLQHELLDYAPNDVDGLLAAGDNFMAWADSDPKKYYDKYEDARFCYARVLQLVGWTGSVLERMLLYFMHTDNLKETLNLRAWFENNSKKYKLTTPTLAELGGYLLDKQLEKVKGVPNAYIESIESVRDMLLQAVKQDNRLPEPHYHLARYYKNLGNVREERLTLENAIRAYDLAKTETVRRRLNRVDTHYRYANLLINNKEFFPAEEQLVKGVELYEDFVSRNLIAPGPQLGQLYAGLGDLEYFVKSGDVQAALDDYLKAEKYGYAPPEVQYRMGAAYYQQENWRNALEYLFKASRELPQNRRILFALGNATYKRGDYFAAQGYYNRLLDILENQRVRLPVLLPNDSPQFLELGERLMMARNNAGVTYEALAKQTGRREYRSKALSLYADSARSWDAITRNPVSMTRMTVGDTPGAPGINLGYLNANNALHPVPGYTPEIFIRIDKDVSEPSHWEELAPFGGLID